MASVTGFTAQKMGEIAAASVVSGYIAGNGHLILQTRDGQTLDAGPARGPQGLPGPQGDVGPAGDPTVFLDEANTYTDDQILAFATPIILTTEDLNTINFQGFYHVNLTANAAVQPNNPAGVAGALEVFGSLLSGIDSFLYQRYTAYNTGDVYIRQRYGTTWFAWKKIPFLSGDRLPSALIPTTLDFDPTIENSTPVIFLRDVGTYSGGGIWHYDEAGSGGGRLSFMGDRRVLIYAGGHGTSSAGVLRIYPDGRIEMSAEGTSTTRPLPFSMQTGNTTCSVSSATSHVQGVTFTSNRFTSPPVVFLFITSASGATGGWVGKPTGITSSGFNIVLWGSSTSFSAVVNWVAIQMTPSGVG